MKTTIELSLPALKSAERTSPVFPRSRGTNPAAKVGLRFERTVVKKIRVTSACLVEHNPWFRYDRLDGGYGYCSPDILLWASDDLGAMLPELIVIEVKNTFVPEAERQLRQIYLPVIERAIGKVGIPLILVKNLAFGGPKAGYTIKDSIERDPPLMQWTGNGPLHLV